METAETSSPVMRQNTRVGLNTSESLPLMPAVLVPKITFEGAIALPIAPPADCAAMTWDKFNPSMDCTTFSCNGEKRMFEEVFEDVMKAPAMPMIFASAT